MKKYIYTLILILSIMSGKGEVLAFASGSTIIVGADISYTNIGAFIENTIDTGANVASQYANLYSVSKESVLDGISYQMSRAMIQQMKNGMVRWIQSGYNGKPSFLINPEQMLRNMAATQAKMAITDISKYVSASANGISAAIVTDIRNNQINTEAAFQKSITPTLGITIQNNVCTAEGFSLLIAAKGWTDAQARAARNMLCASGITTETQQKLLNTCFKESFACGGWNALLDLTQNPGRNTSLGQLDLAVNRIKTQTNNKTAQTTAEVARSGGFLDMKDCIKYKNITVNGKDEQLCDEYQSTSPGQKAVSMMGEVVTDPIKQARLVNEINEAVGSVASAFMSDLVGKGFNVANKAVTDINLTIADATNGVNKSIDATYTSMEAAIKDFTTKNPKSPASAPAYNGTNLQLIPIDHSSISSMSRSMLKDMTIVASSNESYIRTINRHIELLTPYIKGLNTLSVCYDSMGASSNETTLIKSGRDYLVDRNAKISIVYTQMQKDINIIPENLIVLKKSIDFIRSSTDVNAMQAIYQAYNAQLESGDLVRDETASRAQFKYEEHDRKINGLKDESGTLVTKGDMEANLKPKISECECIKTSQTWHDNTCGVSGDYIDQYTHS